jgi:excisionase family DNA binding protein
MKAKTEVKKEHIMLGGHVLSLAALTPDQRAFVEHVREAAGFPGMSVEDLKNMVWSEANPFLERDLIPGRPMATRETYEHPAFRAMLDCIDRKRMALGDLDLEFAEARYTITIPEAAEALGVAESTLRRAVQAGRVDGWKKGGVYYLDPRAVESYRVSIRGLKAEVQTTETLAHAPIGPELEQLPPGALYVKLGTRGNFFLRHRWVGVMVPQEQTGHEPVWGGIVPKGWRRIALLRGKKKEQDYRYFELEPATREGNTHSVLTFAGFYVRGDFRVTRKINNPRKALEAWEAFKGA